MSPYTLAAVEKVKWRIYFLNYFQLNAHTLTKHILSEYEVALFLQFFKNKEAPIPVHLCIKSLYNHHWTEMASVMITQKRRGNDNFSHCGEALATPESKHLLVWFYWFSRVPWQPWSTTGKGNGSQRSYGCFQCLLAMWLAIAASSITFSNKRLKETDGILLHASMSMASVMAWSYSTVKEVLE